MPSRNAWKARAKWWRKIALTYSDSLQASVLYRSRCSREQQAADARIAALERQVADLTTALARALLALELIRMTYEPGSAAWDWSDATLKADDMQPYIPKDALAAPTGAGGTDGGDA